MGSYDNETKKDPQTGQILNNFFQGKEDEAGKTPIGDGLSYPNGIDTSKNPVLIYQSQHGDCTAIDLWTYTAKTNTQSIEANLIIEDLDQYLSATLEGLVFYDANKNHLYDTAHQDYPLAGWTVLLDCEYAETRWQVPGSQAETFPDILYPAYHRKEETSPSDGDSSEESASSLTVDYYYHHFMLKKAKTGKMDGSDFCTYLLFQYDQTDLQHQQEPEPVMDQEKQVQVQVHRMQSTQTGGTSDEYLSSRYVAWIPIHKETQTLATGMYVFSGILVHPETITQDQARKMETRSVKVEVVRQREDYELSTQQMNTHSSFSTMGEEIQQFFWQDLVGKVNEDHQNNPQEINFTYRLADVGYYEPVYVLPETGGITAQTFQLAGAGLLILAFFLARTNRKKKADWE